MSNVFEDNISKLKDRKKFFENNVDKLEKKIKEMKQTYDKCFKLGYFELFYLIVVILIIGCILTILIFHPDDISNCLNGLLKKQ